MDRESLGAGERVGEAVCAMKEPRQCIKCGCWFYDSIFYPEGLYGCRWHDCDRINHISRTAGWLTQRKSWRERFKGWLGVAQ
jgi:hypothetical protein